MSDFGRVYAWLNYFDKTPVDGAVRQMVDRYLGSDLNGEDHEQSAKNAEAIARAARDPNVTAEVLITIAAWDYRAGRYKPAWLALKDAVDIYKKQLEKTKTNVTRHRLGVARWLWGWAGWGLQLHYTAYESWCRASEDFQFVLEAFEDQKNGDRVKWYQQALREWRIDRISRAEEALTWFYEYPAQNMMVRRPVEENDQTDRINAGDRLSRVSESGVGRLGEDLLKHRRKVVDAIVDAEEAMCQPGETTLGDFRLASQNIRDMIMALELSNDRDERGEAYLECGLGLHQIRDNHSAAALVGRAVRSLMPATHQHAVAWWMLGIMQAQPGSGSTEALNSFRIAREEMRELKIRADRANNQELVNWYTDTLSLMDSAAEVIINRQSNLR